MMRPSHLLFFFSLVNSVISAPTTLAHRQNPTIQLIVQNVNSAFTTVKGDIDTTLTAVANSAKDITAQAQLIATIKANFADIETQLGNAAVVIASSTTGLATSLTTAEIQALTSALNTIEALASNLYAAYQTVQKETTTDTFASIKADYETAAAAFTPFTDPLIAYLKGVTGVGEDGVGVVLSALLGAAFGLGSAVGALFTSVGIPA